MKKSYIVIGVIIVIVIGIFMWLLKEVTIKW